MNICSLWRVFYWVSSESYRRSDDVANSRRAGPRTELLPVHVASSTGWSAAVTLDGEVARVTAAPEHEQPVAVTLSKHRGA